MPYRDGKLLPWRFTIRIKDLITDDDPTAEEIRAKGAEIMARFRAVGFDDQTDVDEILMGLRDSEDCDEFNGWLNDLYDWADANLVWLG